MSHLWKGIYASMNLLYIFVLKSLLISAVLGS